MPNHDFKREPKLTRLAHIWHDNKGNWLLATGVIVSVIACVVGYFDLIPHITATTKPNVPSLMATGNTLIIHVVGCESNKGQVVAMLYTADSFSESGVALRAEMLPIQNQEAIWRAHNLQFGAYAVVAFHDINSDQKLQAGIERHGPISRSGSNDQRALTYADLVFQFDENQQEVVVELH